MNRIKAVREDRKLSRRQLAERVQPPTTQQTIYRLERGQMRLSQKWLTLIARALGCRIDDLISSSNGDVSDVESIPFASGRPRAGFRNYRVLTDVLSDAGIASGDTLVGVETPDAISARQPGDAVIVRDRNGVLYLRQWLPPSLLTTNERGPNQFAMKLDDPSRGLTIVAVVVR